MMKKYASFKKEICCLAGILLFLGQTSVYAESNPQQPGQGLPPAELRIADPLEPLNRVFFAFNDKFYFWFLRPVSSGYAKVLPQPARRGISNFFTNVAAPVRIVNNLLQGKFSNSATETGRFLINTTVGVLGFSDAATERFDMSMKDEDFGQTLGRYGLGSGFYINWPVLGASNLRDTVGMAGDSFLSPWRYVTDSTGTRVLIRSGMVVNSTSLRLGEYEKMKESEPDPYVAQRDSYEQRRRRQVAK